MAAAHSIEVFDVAKAYAGNWAVDGVSLTVAPGEFLALLGPSGCGKTTLLRAIAGLIAPDRGEIRLDGTTVVDTKRKIQLPPERRRLGMVFQDYALWPHLRVRENIGFPLAARHVDPASRPAMISAALRRVGLEHRAESFPEQLSGGQQQRIGLARAIVDTPKVLLFDEPLSNLDAALRGALGQEIVRLARELGAAALYVTHDQEEALGLADRIAVMRAGRILCVDKPEALYRNPPLAWVARFLDTGSLVSGEVRGALFHPAGGGPGLGIEKLAGFRDGPAALLVPRPALRLGAADAAIELSVTTVQFRGDTYEVTARWGEAAAAPAIRFLHDRPMRPGDHVPVAFDLTQLRLYTGDLGEPA